MLPVGGSGTDDMFCVYVIGFFNFIFLCNRASRISSNHDVANWLINFFILVFPARTRPESIVGAADESNALHHLKKN